ncbi:histone deacetylase family protein [uncultured Roseovarius sp.]|uniref:histone deacetylase family protein n=1 Tax=uncultured Roseovarius sp. TaxID=293344 RepID=UPI0026317E29|nr:histone deacetylase family protein [uncultured Roseovarius sp.]
MLAVISHADCLNHDAGPLHPECRERLDAIDNQLIMSGLDFVIRRYDAPIADRAALARVHDPDYIARVYAMAPTEGSVEIDGDTVMSPGTLAAAERAAGAGVMGVELIMKGEACPVFCEVRPPGHHAERDKAMGFCLFDNIAVAAAHAMDVYGFERVAIVDFDVHHGNGTEEIFKDDPRVLFCSSFQHPFYPFTGHDSDTPNLVDVPLSAGSDGPAFRAAISEHWLPALHRFRPQFLFISAGFDAHALDDMSSLSLTEHDYAWITRELHAIAVEHCEGRVLSMLEGGYDLSALARSVVSHLKELI